VLTHALRQATGWLTFDVGQKNKMREPLETSLGELKAMQPSRIKIGDSLFIVESEFPECYISRKGKEITCEISEHIYTSQAKGVRQPSQRGQAENCG